MEQYVSEILIQPCFEHLVVSCVDTSTIGFSLYSRDHLQTSVSQVFTDLDLSGSPVELELVFHCVLILPLTHWVSGPAFFLVVQACFAFFHSPSLHRIFNHSLFALAYVQKSFNRSDVFSTYRIFQPDETPRYDDCLRQKGFQVGGHPVSEVFWPPVNLSLSACTCVSFFWPWVSTRCAPNSRLCIRGICPSQNEWTQKPGLI